MPFVKRDADGAIIALYQKPMEDGLEEIAPDDPAIAEFLVLGDKDDTARREFLASDLGLARVLEDLIDLLIEKGVFRFTDLPAAAQRKLIERRGLRKEFAYVETLFGAGAGEPLADPSADDKEDGDGFL